MRDAMLETAQLLTADAEAFVLSTVIDLDSSRPLTRAVLRGTAQGVFEARINGEPVSTGVLAPGWSAYEWRMPVEEYDVLSLIHSGSRLEVLVGNGWW